MCAAMKWAHLPVAGGLYDQHPLLMDRFAYIFSEQAKHEEAQRKKEEADRKRQMGGRKPSRGASRPRR